MTPEPEARCPICGHIEALDYRGNIGLHFPWGSVSCKGTGYRPWVRSVAPRVVINFT